MERKLLESRQLTPAVTDRQLIKKIARHYGREIEIAVVTRGINSIQNLESFISEYATINQRTNRESGYMETHDKVNARVNRETMNAMQPVHNKEVGWKQQPSHKKNESNTNKTYPRQSDRQLVNTIEFVNNGASTSTARRGEEKKIKSVRQ